MNRRQEEIEQLAQDATRGRDLDELQAKLDERERDLASARRNTRARRA